MALQFKNDFQMLQTAYSGKMEAIKEKMDSLSGESGV